MSKTEIEKLTEQVHDKELGEKLLPPIERMIKIHGEISESLKKWNKELHLYMDVYGEHIEGKRK